MKWPNVLKIAVDGHYGLRMISSVVQVKEKLLLLKLKVGFSVGFVQNDVTAASID